MAGSWIGLSVPGFEEEGLTNVFPALICGRRAVGIERHSISNWEG